MRISSNTSKRGFTLVEAMVAMSILSLAVTGPLLIAQKGLGSAIYSRDQITAIYLAQEAVEYVRNVRDSNRLSDSPWLGQFSSCKTTDLSPQNACQIDAHVIDFDDLSGDAIQTCTVGSCEPLSIYQDPGSGDFFYGYGTGANWQPTKFTRTVTIDDRKSPKEAAVSVTVSWNTGLYAPAQSFSVKEYLFDF